MSTNSSSHEDLHRLEEESTHLLGTNDNASTNPSSRGKFTAVLIAAILSATLIISAVAYYSNPLDFGAMIGETTTDLAAKGPSLFSSGALRTYYTNRNENNNNIIYLDRHNMDCEPKIMKGFEMIGGPRYKFQCYESQLGSRTGAWGYNTGWQTAGSNIYLDRQKVWCPDRTFLSRITGKAKNSWGWKFMYDFACSRYDFEDFSCSDHYSSYNDAGDGIIYLDRHDIVCPDNKGLNGFQLETSWGRIRYKFKCCSAYGHAPTAAPIASPTQQPIANPTTAPTFVPTVKPSRAPTFEPTLEPVADPTVAPTLEPSVSPTLEPTIEPSMSPVATPTQEPSVGKSVPNKPADMSDAEWEKALAYEKKKASAEIALPEPVVVLQKPNASNVEEDGEDSGSSVENEEKEEEIPESPIVAGIKNEIADSKAEKAEKAAQIAEEAADVANNASIPEVQKKTPSPDSMIPSGSEYIRYCAYTHTKKEGYTKVSPGCAIIADENIDALPVGETANAVLACGMAPDDGEGIVKMDQERLNSFAILMAGGISYLKPGAKTSATFFTSGDFSGASYTYTSGFHPPITNAANFNDNIKSVKLVTTAEKADLEKVEFPEVCVE